MWLPAWNLVLLGVLIALGFVAKPAYRAYRAQCVEANLQAARTAARQGDWAAARDKAHSVLLARGQDLEACRIWTRALGKLGTADAYAAASELFANPRATCADMLENLQMMALQGPQAVALSAYASLPPALREQVVFRAADSSSVPQFVSPSSQRMRRRRCRTGILRLCMVQMTPPAPLTYCPDLLRYARRPSREVWIGHLGIGARHPVRVQSMITADTRDTPACVAEILTLAAAGCEIVRITAQTKSYAANLQHIAREVRAAGCQVPLVADIHFKPDAAMEAAKWV
ncbi:MAG: flavodoxin-dependent (E)-4-hydroxy-3-methylbut-2-enyl-diphosphate synthase, partial [Verrucomicrobiota bacterium]